MTKIEAQVEAVAGVLEEMGSADLIETARAVLERIAGGLEFQDEPIAITEASIDAFKKHAHPAPLEPNIRPALTAFLRELGFEVAE